MGKGMGVGANLVFALISTTGSMRKRADTRFAPTV